MNEEWLIDGYNLLHACICAKDRSRKLPATKTDLCTVLAGFASARKQKVWAVLDGAGEPDELKVHETVCFSAVYSQKVSADNFIEKYIYQNKATMTFVVVTDDRMITELARGGGARVLKNSQFLEMLKDGGRENEAAVLKQEALSHGFNRPFDRLFKIKGL